MATPWPPVTAWPNDIREHAIYLSDYLRKALVCIDSAEDQPVPKPPVKTMIAAMSVLIAKCQNNPDVSAVMQAITTIQSELKTTAETVQSTAMSIQQNTVTHQQIAILSQETNQAVKEAAETRRTTTELLQETNDIAKATNDIAKAIQSTPSPKGAHMYNSEEKVFSQYRAPDYPTPQKNIRPQFSRKFAIREILPFLIQQANS